MKIKKIIALLSVAIILIAGIEAVEYGWKNYQATNTLVSDNGDGTYNYNAQGVDGVADVIISKNVEEAEAVNDVASIVFDFRGYDTLGESFILLTAIAGSFVILASHKKEKKEEKANEV